MTQNQQPPQLPTHQQLYREIPLYRGISLAEHETQDVYDLMVFHGTLDGHCTLCKKDSVFKCQTFGGGFPISPANQVDTGARYNMDESYYKDRTFNWQLSCSRNSEHLSYLYFCVNDKTLIKIGQFPSLADLALPEYRKYEKLLKKQYSEFVNAIRLGTNGVGVGSFVYLRRIFEQLIKEAHESAKNDANWNESAYQAEKHWDKQILLLRHHLPDFLVEHTQLFSILSVGIHQLDEDECKKRFPIVRTAIEAILDEKLYKLEQEKKRLEARRQLNSLTT